MANVTDFALRYQISADGSKASATIKDLDKQFAKLGGANTLGNIAKDAQKEWGSLDSVLGKATSTIGSIPVPAAAAAAGIAGTTFAVAGLAKELFDLAKQGAELGASFGSFESKTGLTASAVSTLAFAAKLAGKDLGDLQRPMVAFAHYVEKTGGNVNDLSGELDKAIRSINKMPDGIEKMNKAGEMWGKRGGLDMINLAKKMPDGFSAAQREAERLGVTLSEDDVQAAKEFRREFNVMMYQVEIGAAKFGLTYAPQITAGLKSITEFLGENQDTWKRWGYHVADSVGVVIKAMKGWAGFYEDLQQNHPYIWLAMFGGVGAINAGLDSSVSDRMRNDYKVVHSKYDKPLPGEKKPGMFDEDTGVPPSRGIHRAPRESDSEFRQFFKDLGFSVVRTFGKAINDGSPHTYGGAADISVRGKSADDIFRLMVKALEKGYRVFDERHPQPGVKQTGPHIHVENAKTTLTKPSAFFPDGLTPERLAYLQHLDQERLGRATGESGFEAFSKKRQDDADKGAEQGIKTRVDGYRRLAQIGEAVYNALLEDDERLFSRAKDAGDTVGGLTAAQSIFQAQMAQIDASVQSAADIAGSYKDGSPEQLEAVHDLTLARINGIAAMKKAEEDLAQRRKELWDAEIDRSNELIKVGLGDIDVIQSQTEYIDEQLGLVKTGIAVVDKALKKQSDDYHKKHKNPGAKDATDTHNLWDLGTVKDGVDIHEEQMNRMKSITNDAFGSMSDAVGQAIAGWALYGDSIGASLKKATAAILANIAAQAIVNAIWETAQGFAMLALAFMGHPGAGQSAAHHFRSAAIYGAVGIGAAVGAKALSGGGGAGGSSASGGGNYSASSQKDNNSPYTRNADAAWASRRNDVARLADTVDLLHKKIEAVPPGHVFMKGMAANRGAVGRQVVSDIKSDGSLGVDLRRAAGGR